MNDPARLLVVEDEIPLAKGIAENLEGEGYVVEVAHDGRAALERMRGGDLDLVVLDVMLPEMDGFEVCETVRLEGNGVPILFLTARGGVDDRIRGLEAGGSDYLPKPFHLRELLLRTAAILRRSSWSDRMPTAGARVVFGDNHVDFRTHVARAWDGKEFVLAEREALVLKALCEREGEVVSREEILDKVWGRNLLPSTRTIDGFVRRLCERFEPDQENPRHLHTMHGIGYRFTREPEVCR